MKSLAAAKQLVGIVVGWSLVVLSACLSGLVC